jgi:hypothetical protein
MRVTRRRAWIAGLGGVALVLIVVSLGLAIHNRHGRVFVRAGGGDATNNPALSTIADTTTVAESTTIGATTTIAQTPTATGTTTITQRSQRNAAPSPAGSPWRVSPTIGLTNLAPVTITATGIPSASYYVGQCPAGQTPGLNECVLNNVVTVSDGTMSSTVHVFWWLDNGQIDCGIAPGACVVGVMNARTTAITASFAISFDPARRPQITVTPDQSLTDGQSVVVHGVDVGEGNVQVEECLLPQWASCTGVETKSQPDGTFATAMTVYRRLQWDGHGPGSGTCGIDGDCVLEVWITPKDLDSYRIWINPNQPVTLHFAPATPST